METHPELDGTFRRRRVCPAQGHFSCYTREKVETERRDLTKEETG